MNCDEREKLLKENATPFYYSSCKIYSLQLLKISRYTKGIYMYIMIALFEPCVAYKMSKPVLKPTHLHGAEAR